MAREVYAHLVPTRLYRVLLYKTIEGIHGTKRIRDTKILAAPVVPWCAVLMRSKSF